jgi:DNA polymerase III subunit beta
MKIKIKKNVFVESLSHIQGIVEKNSIKPITSNALIKAFDKKITVSATNLQLAIKTTDENIKIEKEGQISVNAKKIYEIIKQLPENEIILEEKENYTIKISSGKAQVEIMGLPPEDFPEFLEEEKKDFYLWDKKIFLSMINSTSFSISRDDSKPNICGCFIEKLEDGKIRMVTTDGYRLSVVEEKASEDFFVEEGITIPLKGINEINKIILETKEKENIYICIKKNIFIIKNNNITLFIRLIEKKFPNYKVIIPGEGINKKIIKLEKTKIREALKIMCVIANENNKPVYFRFLENDLFLNTEDSDFGSAREEIKIEDKIEKEINFCINGSYLLDIINATEENLLIEYFEEENKPIVVKTQKNKNLKYIIMPMKMD